MRQLISIVIPIYNGAWCIGRCLESIYSQRLNRDEFEVICVNDCSTDETASVLEGYCAKYPNLIICNHSVNKRQGGGRNTGIKVARGEYVTFIDCDDVYLPDSLTRVVEELKKPQQLDVLMFDFQQTRLGVTKELQYAGNHSRIVTGVEFLKENEFTYAAWSYAFKRSFLLDNKLLFVENLQFEDGDWCMSVLLQARRVKYVPLMEVHYMIEENSTTSLAAGAKNIVDLFEAGRRWHDLYVKARSIDAGLACKVKWHWLVGAKVGSYRLVHVKSLTDKYRLLKKYYKGKYNRDGGLYLRCLSKFPLASACAIHLLSPMLRSYLSRKHKA